MKKAFTIALTIVFVLALAAPLSASDMKWDITYEMEGEIDIDKQLGHHCNTGAQLNQIIEGEGEMSKSMETAQVQGKLTVDDTQDWVTAEDAVRNLTVTSAIHLCTPAKHEYTTTKYEPIDGGLVVVGVEQLEPLTVETDTPFEDLPLPESVAIELCDGSTMEVPVDWSGAEEDYDCETAGTYVLEGELDLPDHIDNPDELVAEVVIISEHVYDLNIDSTDGGSVTTPGEGTFKYADGTGVDLEAVADDGYEFVEWTGTIDGIADVDADSTSIIMDDHASITANFEPIVSEYTVTFNEENEVEDWTVTVYEDEKREQEVDSVSAGAEGETYQAKIDLEDGTYYYTIEKEGYQDEEGAVTVDGEAKQVDFTLNVEKYKITFIIGDGNGTAGDVTDDGPYKEGSKVEILAEPKENYVFDEWSATAGEFDNENADNTIFTMPAQDVELTANFKPCFKPTIVLEDDTHIVYEINDSFDIEWEVKNLGDEENTQEVTWTIVLEERARDGETKHSETRTKELTIGAGETKPLETYTVYVDDDGKWEGNDAVGGEDVFTIIFKTDCNDDVKRVFVEEAPDLDFLCGICTTLQVDPGQNRIRLNTRDRAGNLIEVSENIDDWEVFLPEGIGGDPTVIDLDPDPPAYDFAIIVKDIPVGTDKDKIKVTYKGYDDPPGDIVITAEVE